MVASVANMVLASANRTWNVELYLPDAVAGMWGFNTGPSHAVATAPTQMTIPENCRLVDFVITTAPTAVGAELQLDSMNVNGGTIRYALNTGGAASTPTRVPISIPMKKGQILTAIQF